MALYLGTVIRSIERIQLFPLIMWILAKGLPNLAHQKFHYQTVAVFFYISPCLCHFQPDFQSVCLFDNCFCLCLISVRIAFLDKGQLFSDYSLVSLIFQKNKAKI